MVIYKKEHFAGEVNIEFIIFTLPAYYNGFIKFEFHVAGEGATVLSIFFVFSVPIALLLLLCRHHHCLNPLTLHELPLALAHAVCEMT